MNELHLRSPAKINLFLRILKKREDGYHELASLFQAIDLCDTMHCTLSTQDCLECSDTRLPTDRSNLIWKAIDLYRAKTGLQFQVALKLEKLIPMEAGLGGGSSNAATALWAVNALQGSPISEEQLMEWAAEIGSDVPFFFSTGTAYCTGRGEIVQSLQPLWHKNVWVLKTVSGLPTSKVYGQLQLESSARAVDSQQPLKSFLAGPFAPFNDLEIAAFALLPELAMLKKDLLALGFKEVWLAGSGSSMLCVEPTETPPPTLPAKFEGFSQLCRAIYRPINGWY